MRGLITIVQISIRLLDRNKSKPVSLSERNKVALVFFMTVVRRLFGVQVKFVITLLLCNSRQLAPNQSPYKKKKKKLQQKKQTHVLLFLSLGYVVTFNIQVTGSEPVWPSGKAEGPRFDTASVLLSL